MIYDEVWIDLNKFESGYAIAARRNEEIAQIKIKLTNKGELIDNSKFSVKFVGNNAKGDLTDGEAARINGESGAYLYTFSKENLSVSGQFKRAYFEVYDSSGKKITSSDVKFRVIDEADMSADQATIHITILEEMVKKHEDYIEKGKENWEGFVDQNKEIIESVDPGGKVLTELIEARKPDQEEPFPTLKERLDTQIGKTKEFREWNDSVIEKMANEFTERGVNVNWFGAKGDGVTDDTESIQSAIDFAFAHKIKKIVFPHATYLISRTLKFYHGTILQGNKSMFIFENGEYVNDFCMLFDTEDGEVWSGRKQQDFIRIFDFEAKNNSSQKLKLMAIGNGSDVKGVTANNFFQTIFILNAYIDYCKIEEIHTNNHRGNLYAIEKRGNGDEVNIYNCHMSSDNLDNLNHIRIVACQGGRIENTINGNINLYRCESVTISNSHLEKGSIILEDSGSVLSNNFIWLRQNTQSPFVLKDSNAGSGDWIGPTVLIEKNTTIVKYANEDYSTDTYDLELNNYYSSLILKSNVRKLEAVGGSYNKANMTAWKIKGPEQKFCLESIDSLICKGKEVLNKKNVDVDATTSGYDLLTSVASIITDIPYQGSAGTMFYTAMLILDDTRKLGLSNTSSATRKVVTTNSNSIKITIDKKYIQSNSTLRILKGSSENEFEYYVDIPFLVTNNLIDNGKSVNGFKWMPMETKKDKPSLNKSNHVVKIGTNVIAASNTMPASGAWIKGDRIIRNEFSSGSSLEFVCTESGSPGTWIGINQLD